ncbi:MAG: hypothetical protein K0R92_2634 [Lachnospiraceae bacterium]|jgi:uncharacterized membrane protein|nr:hypothetical protein [Lachnospiraceae bacterium]
MKEIIKNKRYKMAPVILSIVLLAFLIFLPTGYEGAVIYQGTEQCVARVLSTDDTAIISTGLIKSGEQNCRLEILNGKFKGVITEGFNMLNGSMATDKLFEAGDKAQVVISYEADNILTISMIDIYRINKEMILAGIFLLLLILFAGKTGIRAILSFFVTILMLWKVLVPGYLNGYNPVLIGFGITLIITFIIIILIYGFDRRALSAISGAVLGIFTTAMIGIIFTDLFQIHGTVMSYSESLLYSGYSDLNLTRIFISGIFIGSSGAIIDVAVDITSAVNEVIGKKPGMSWKEAALSGVHVGRDSVGTMVTTLLLAYSGGYIALLMVFMAQGTPFNNIMNYKYVAAEILDTLIGSIGLVMVAPFTAVISGLLLTQKSFCIRKKNK